jgi:hypothetical protein
MRGDSAASIVSAQPSPELLNRVGHTLLLAVAASHSGPLQAAAGALERLAELLPDASPEGRMVAVLMALTDDPTPRAVVTSPAPARAREAKARRTSQSDKQTSQSKAAVPRMDSSGRLQPSKEIDGIAVVSQAEARKALGVSCVQMLRLEGQKALQRIQENGSRLVFYDVCQVQKLIDLIDATPTPPL